MMIFKLLVGGGGEGSFDVRLMSLALLDLFGCPSHCTIFELSCCCCCTSGHSNLSLKGAYGQLIRAGGSESQCSQCSVQLLSSPLASLGDDSTCVYRSTKADVRFVHLCLTAGKAIHRFNTSNVEHRAVHTRRRHGMGFCQQLAWDSNTMKATATQEFGSYFKWDLLQHKNNKKKIQVEPETLLTCGCLIFLWKGPNYKGAADQFHQPTKSWKNACV